MASAIGRAAGTSRSPAQSTPFSPITGRAAGTGRSHCCLLLFSVYSDLPDRLQFPLTWIMGRVGERHRPAQVFDPAHLSNPHWWFVQFWLSEAVCDQRHVIALRPVGYERVYLPLREVTDTPFHIQGDVLTLCYFLISVISRLNHCV